MVALTADQKARLRMRHALASGKVYKPRGSHNCELWASLLREHTQQTARAVMDINAHTTATIAPLTRLFEGEASGDIRQRMSARRTQIALLRKANSDDWLLLKSMRTPRPSPRDQEEEPAEQMEQAEPDPVPVVAVPAPVVPTPPLIDERYMTPLQAWAAHKGPRLV